MYYIKMLQCTAIRFGIIRLLKRVHQHYVAF